MRLSKLQSMDPIAFEKYVGTLFSKRGYQVEDTQASADEGIDLIVRQGRRMAVVQCKRYQGSVGQPVVRDLYGVMLHTGAVEAYLVTTGTVTAAARRWAEGKPIHLVDQHRLVEWARTGRLNYEKPNVLKSPKRSVQFVIGLLFVVAVVLMLVAPERFLAARDGAMDTIRPLVARIEAIFQPTWVVTPVPFVVPIPNDSLDQDSTDSSPANPLQTSSQPSDLPQPAQAPITPVIETIRPDSE